VVLLQPDVTPRITMFLQSKVISEQVKAALQEIVKRRSALADVVAQRQQKEARLKEIADEQDRIRKNMEQLEKTSDLYKKYVAKLTAQEDEFDATRADIAKLQEQEKKLKDDLDAYIRGLNVS
jgi:chromosome segregation ATPase